MECGTGRFFLCEFHFRGSGSTPSNSYIGSPRGFAGWGIFGAVRAALGPGWPGWGAGARCARRGGHTPPGATGTAPGPHWDLDGPPKCATVSICVSSHQRVAGLGKCVRGLVVELKCYREDLSTRRSAPEFLLVGPSTVLPTHHCTCCLLLFTTYNLLLSTKICTVREPQALSRRCAARGEALPPRSRAGRNTINVCWE